ncbi:MAG: sensor histidine kinase [Ignavibacteria bacterium]
MSDRFKIFRSIFPKLILIVIIFGAFINIAIWAFFRFSTEGHPHLVPRYIKMMDDYVVQDLGYPPDTLKARQISDELGINIRFQSHDFNYTTSSNVPMLDDLAKLDDFKDKFPYSENFVVEYDRLHCTVFKSPKGVFILIPPTPQDFFNPERALFILIILVSVIFIPLYIILRLLFNPLKTLSSAVHQIGKGNYDVDVPIKRKDELGELGDSIKTMAGNIKHSMKSKEQLLIDVSHELRSPLTRLKLGLEVDAPRERLEEDVREMESMITGLLDSYRADSSYDQLSIETVNLKELLNDVKEEYEIEQRVFFNFEESKDCIIKADPAKITIVMRNLIDNALKYSSDNVYLKLFCENNQCSISVTDKGIGIPGKDQKFIFEPFYRSDPSRSRRTGGFGLGLSIAKKIMDAHKGIISMKSKVNEGTEFMLTFVKS